MTTYQTHQKLTPLVNRYHVYQEDDSGNPGQLVAFAQQKRLALRERITLYTDETQSDVAFTVQARTIVDLGARYDILDGRGSPLAVIGKAFNASLLRSTWHVFSPGTEDQPAVIVSERSLAVAVVRRAWDFIPLADTIPVPFRYHFNFTAANSDTVVATYDKISMVRDRYRLDITEQPGLLDDSVFIAMGIMLDALQGR